MSLLLRSAAALHIEGSATASGASAAGIAVKVAAAVAVCAFAGAAAAVPARTAPAAAVCPSGVGGYTAVAKTATPSGAVLSFAAAYSAAARRAPVGATSAATGVVASGAVAVTRFATATTFVAGVPAGQPGHVSAATGQVYAGIAAAGRAGKAVAAAGRAYAGGTADGRAAATTSPRLYTAARAILDCVLAALVAGPGGAPSRACVVPGALAWDECDCGLLAVTVSRIYPSAAFPSPASNRLLAEPCAVPWLAADMAVTVLQCAPQPQGAELAPTCEHLSAAAETQAIDLGTIRRALRCCLADLRDQNVIDAVVLKDTVPVGPEGGCVGTVTNLTVGVPNCLCPA